MCASILLMRLTAIYKNRKRKNIHDWVVGIFYVAWLTANESVPVQGKAVAVLYCSFRNCSSTRRTISLNYLIKDDVKQERRLLTTATTTTRNKDHPLLQVGMSCVVGGRTRQKIMIYSIRVESINQVWDWRQRSERTTKNLKSMTPRSHD